MYVKNSTGSYQSIAQFYDLIDFPFEKLSYRHMRKHWLGDLNNEAILEIGVGTGKNLNYYNNNNRVVAIDKEREMLILAKKRLLKSNIRGSCDLILTPSLPWILPLKSFSVVIATFVFCTMELPKPVLDELLNWTSNNSKLIIFEYIKPKKKPMKFLFNLLNPLTTKLFGVNFNRMPTEEYLDDNWRLIKKTHVFHDLIVVLEFERI